MRMAGSDYHTEVADQSGTGMSDAQATPATPVLPSAVDGKRPLLPAHQPGQQGQTMTGAAIAPQMHHGDNTNTFLPPLGVAVPTQAPAAAAAALPTCNVPTAYFTTEVGPLPPPLLPGQPPVELLPIIGVHRQQQQEDNHHHHHQNFHPHRDSHHRHRHRNNRHEMKPPLPKTVSFQPDRQAGAKLVVEPESTPRSRHTNEDGVDRRKTQGNDGRRKQRKRERKRRRSKKEGGKSSDAANGIIPHHLNDHKKTITTDTDARSTLHVSASSSVKKRRIRREGVGGTRSSADKDATVPVDWDEEEFYRLVSSLPGVADIKPFDPRSAWSWAKAKAKAKEASKDG